MESPQSIYFISPVPHEVVLDSEPYQAEVAFVSVNNAGTPGRLSGQVMEKLDYSSSDFPSQEQLSKGFYYLQSDRRIPVIFIVTVDVYEKRPPQQNLATNLATAITEFSSYLMGKVWWMPLMGTGNSGGQLTFDESYEIAMQTLRKMEIARHAKIIISVPANAQGRSFFARLSAPPPQQPERDAKARYWMLKFDREHWGNGFQPGGFAYYNTYLENGEPRPEYELFKNIKAGDIALGFDHSGHGNVACVFDITKGIEQHRTYGEIISMVIREILDPPIPLEQIRESISFADDLVSSSLVRLLPLDENTCQQILAIAKAKDAEPKAPSRKKSINPYYLSEGRHRETDDKLRFQDDIDSLANVIALKSVDPPLAIGLFGHWGSGKSFFMQKLEERIDQLKKEESDTYIKTVVHVKFNSWHYSDSNLWACLITELFDSLNNTFREGKEHQDLKSLAQTLQLTSSQKDAAEGKAKELEGRIEKLQQAQAEKREKLEDLSGINLLKLVLSDEKVKQDLAAFDNKDVEKIINDKGKLGEYVDYFKQSKEKFQDSFLIVKGARAVRGWRWAAVLLIAAVIGVGVFLLMRNADMAALWKNITSFISGLTTLFLLLAAKAKDLAAKLDKYYDRIRSLYNTVTTRPDETPVELSSDAAELEEVKTSLNVINKKINDTRTEIDDILSGRKLLEFIDQRVKDEGYAKQLGLISWIRRDFSKLDELLRQQHQLTEEERNKIFNPENVTLRIDRIVLYIDDLDRCKEEIVVKVLEAVHLLLAFPLFVVVVGVDPRWLNNALDEKYKTLLRGYRTGDDQKNNARTKKNAEVTEDEDQVDDEELILAGVATTYDYLEKIFQIPFTLKPIHREARKDLIAYLIRNELEGSLPTSKEPIFDTQPHRAPGMVDPPPEPSPGSTKVEPTTAPPTATTPRPTAPARPAVVRQKLIFTKGEKAYMQEIGPIFGHTPRSINRYVNIYRIIKSHNSFEVDETFSEDDFIPVMAVLSIVVGYSVFAQQLINELSSASDDITMKQFLTECSLSDRLKEILTGENRDNGHAKKNKQKVNANGRESHGIGSKALAMPVALYKRNLELVSRFSFRTISM